MEGFKTLVITSPHVVAQEGVKIAALLEAGVDFVHLRKPSYSCEQMEQLIESIPARLHPSLTLHDHFPLTERYAIGGIHLNARNPRINAKAGLRVSKSMHSKRELSDANCFHYVTISPIFSSISKPGYDSAFVPTEWKELAQSGRVVALGGITLESLSELKDAGFYGAAMLGAIWEASLPFNKVVESLNKRVKQLKH